MLGCGGDVRLSAAIERVAIVRSRVGYRRVLEASEASGTSLESYGSMAPFDLDACIQQLLHKQLLHEALLREICEKTKEVLMRESNVVHVSAPVTVVGDIHGCALPQIHHMRLVTLNHFFQASFMIS